MKEVLLDWHLVTVEVLKGKIDLENFSLRRFKKVKIKKKFDEIFVEMFYEYEVFHQTRLERVAIIKQSSLLGPFES
jgi:hypothetical protein